LSLHFKSKGEKNPERTWQRGSKLDRGLKHVLVKSLRELGLFNMMRRILRGDLIAPLSCKDDKT